MNVELMKRMMDACYLAQRVRGMLPPLPAGVTPAYNVVGVFTSLNSQNAESKNHAGLGIAAGAGVMLVGKILIPMIETSINIS